MFTAVERAEHRPWDDLPRLEMPAWLGDAAKPERVCAVLSKEVPELASGALALHGCKVRRYRLQEDSDRWSGIYTFTVERSAHTQVVQVWGELIPPGQPPPAGIADGARFGSEAWRVYLEELRLELRTMPEDAKLPALPHLTDPAAARELLERSIRACAPRYRELCIGVCTPRVMRYKFGSRCTILYHLEYPAGTPDARRGPAAVVAKTYDGEKGRNAYVAMRALWESSLGRSGDVTIAEPLAFVPELNLLVQGAIREEQTLRQFLRWALATDGEPSRLPRLRGYLRRVARGLAELHGCGVRFGEAVGWEDELREIREQNARIAVYLPQHAKATAALLPGLEELAAVHPADPAGPAHRSFRPAQVLLHADDIGLIDFDGFCQAEPAMDLALFTTEIRHIGLGKLWSRGDVGGPDPEARLSLLRRLEQMCAVFLDEYACVRPVSRDRIALWEALYLVGVLQNTWTKVKPERLDEAHFLLGRHRMILHDRRDRQAGSPP